MRVGDAEVNAEDHPVLAEIGRIALLCNDAALEEIDGAWTVRGDPTEAALLVLGRKAGLDLEALLGIAPGGGDPLFLGRQAHEHLSSGGGWGFDVRQGGAGTPAAPGPDDADRPGRAAHEEQDRETVHYQAAKMAREALRVLGLAYRRFPEFPPSKTKTLPRNLSGWGWRA